MKIIALSTILIFFYGMDIIIFKNEMLVFENYTQNKIRLPNELKSMDKKYYYSEGILLSFENLENLGGKQKVSNGIFNILCEQNVINLWNIFNESDINPYSSNHKKFIELRKQELELYNLGKFKVSKNFDTYFVLVVDGERDNYIINRSLYLMNVHNNRLKSLTRIAYYICFDGTCHSLFTEVLHENVFYLKRKEICSDNILPNELKNNKVVLHAKFSYDENGYLKVLNK